MNNTKIRKDANGNIIDKSNKNYHITITENFVTIISNYVFMFEKT